MNARALALRSIAVAFGAIALAVTPVHAQDAAVASSAVSASAPVQEVAPATAQGPSVESASVAVRRTDAAATTPQPAPARSTERGVALMIVGGAAILTGIVVGGDAGHAISIGGAVVGLIGLYQYLQ